MGQTPESGSFWGVVRRVASAFDALLAVVPLVLVTVWALPAGSRRGLVLAFADPTPTAVFTTHLVHISTPHLVTNLLVYVAVVPAAYLLSAQSGTLPLFRWAYVAVLLVVPPVLSLSTLLVASSGTGMGFSGVNMALFGLFTLFLGDYLSRHLAAALDTWGGTLYLLSLAGIAALAVPTALQSALLATAAVLGAVLTLRTEFGLRLRRRQVWKQVGYSELALFCGVVFTALPVLAIGADATGGVEVYVHVLGYVLAFVPLYITVQLGTAGALGAGQRLGERRSR